MLSVENEYMQTLLSVQQIKSGFTNDVYSDVHGDLLLVNRAPFIKALTSTGWGKLKETLMVVVDGEMYGCVKSNCVLCGTLLMEMVERIWLLQLELGMHEVSRVFSVSDIQISLASMIGRVYASFFRSSLIYGSEAYIYI